MISAPDATAAVDPRELQKLGVLVPIRFQPVRFRPGRHPLGRAGEGMRLLRQRPFVPGEDNPRDIDKFSAPHERNVIEWEDEAQASVAILADVSGSMSSAMLAPIRNLCVLQLTYSLTRAGDRVRLALFDTNLRDNVSAANLAEQLRQTAVMLRGQQGGASTDVWSSLAEYLQRNIRSSSQLTFVISDFADVDPAMLPGKLRRVVATWGRNIVPVIVSWEIPAQARGAFKVADAESARRRMEYFGRRRIDSINRDEADRVNGLARQFRSAGLDVLTIRHQREVYPGLVQLARFRRGRRS